MCFGITGVELSVQFSSEVIWHWMRQSHWRKRYSWHLSGSTGG